MLFADRGLGKTFFCLSTAIAVSSGKSMLKWDSPQPQPVLIIDGEMPSGLLQERMAALTAGQEISGCDLRFITHDTQPSLRNLDLSQREDQLLLEPHLEGVSLIIVDNISTLCRTGKENEAEGWLPMQTWALGQRAMGRSVLFVHHAGKSGEQRGSSRREDILDTVIKLQRPTNYTQNKGAVFEVHFTKSRGIFGDDVAPIEVILETGPDNSLFWSHRSIDDSTYDKVVTLANEGLSQKEITEELKVNKSTVWRHIEKAKKNGDVR